MEAGARKRVINNDHRLEKVFWSGPLIASQDYRMLLPDQLSTPFTSLGFSLTAGISPRLSPENMLFLRGWKS